jgi:putrescine transport system ATP-binding protein
MGWRRRWLRNFRHPEAGANVAEIPLLRIDAVVKKFGGFRAVDRLSLDIRAGEFFALLGPSGCGKTTLLRMLAGFEMPDEGRIFARRQEHCAGSAAPAPINMMFQNYALFPHLTVRDNIAFGLKRAGKPRSAIDTRVAEMIALVKLEGLAQRKPDQLSGGQKTARGAARAPWRGGRNVAARRAAGRARQEAARKHPARADGAAAAGSA